MMAQKLLSRLIPLSEFVPWWLVSFGCWFCFCGVGFLCFGLLCCFLFLFRVLVVLFVPSLPWDYLLDYVQVYNRSFLWLSQFDGHACNLPIQFPASTNLLNDLAKAMKALDGKNFADALGKLDGTQFAYRVASVRQELGVTSGLWHLPLSSMRSTSSLKPRSWAWESAWGPPLLELPPQPLWRPWRVWTLPPLLRVHRLGTHRRRHASFGRLLRDADVDHSARFFMRHRRWRGGASIVGALHIFERSAQRRPHLLQLLHPLRRRWKVLLSGVVCALELGWWCCGRCAPHLWKWCSFRKNVWVLRCRLKMFLLELVCWRGCRVVLLQGAAVRAVCAWRWLLVVPLVVVRALDLLVPLRSAGVCTLDLARLPLQGVASEWRVRFGVCWLGCHWGAGVCALELACWCCCRVPAQQGAASGCCS